MTSREQFEEWCLKLGLSTDTDSDSWGQQKYKYDRIQCMWYGWQASREAVEIALPDVCAWNLCELLDKKEVIEAIRTAGIKVKGE
ncbi:hypothetical protein EYY98_08325 [Obesumbacterium proteus]|nr:hypothetical protein EYY98_08325 [Obesumbacterium proteus]